MRKKVEKTAVKETGTGIITVSLSKIVTGDFTPRKSFNEDELQELAESIKQVGVLQSVLVRPKGKMFEIVYGERRYTAFGCSKAVLQGSGVISLSGTSCRQYASALTASRTVQSTSFECRVVRHIPLLRTASGTYSRLCPHSRTATVETVAVLWRSGKDE
ncbi:MAG: ParB N-terminal domain-containing protein [Tannerella sp.]|jgi:hypothetical protein|nr:ParB N-terminal domain-containing protein [Tannerella sp.]